jgi:hypothetical protein
MAEPSIDLRADPVLLCAKIARGEIDLVRALGLQPAVLERLVERARGMIAHQKREEGLALLEQLAGVCNRSASLPFLLASALDEGGEHERAAAAYARTIVRAERNGDKSILQKARFCRGRNAAALGALAAAIEDMRAAESGPDQEISRIAALWSARLEAIR